MADMFAATACSSSNTHPPEQDDISLFLHQILLRSSSSSLAAKQTQSCAPSSHVHPDNQHHPVQLSVPNQISNGLGVFSSAGAYIPPVAANVSSSSAGTIENDPDDYDCESEEGFENLAEEMAAKPAPPRNPSKRSRAAEVHNLSEKRRRSRINEKMKALQKLIPNSNKTDKASMLDEAIEYLKQLQLQVQMLTMRNGLSLYPMCAPGLLQPNQQPQMRMGFNEENGSLNMNMTGLVQLNQGTPANTMLNSLPIQCTNPNPNQPSASSFSHIINETSFRLESTIPTQRGPFQFHESSEEICREGLLPHPQTDVEHTRPNSSEFQMGAKASIVGRDRPESLQLTNSGHQTIFSPRLDG